MGSTPPYDLRGRPLRSLMPREAFPLALLLVTLLGLLLRLFHLGAQSLWVDEMLTIGQGSVPGHSLWEQFLDDVQNPLPMVIVAWLGRVSTDELWLRLPGAVIGALSIPLLFESARRIGGGRTALFAALLFAVHPMHIAHCQEVRGYAYLVFFALAATVVALEAAPRLGLRSGLALVGLGTAAALSNLQGLFWMGGLALALVTSGRAPRSQWPRWAACFVLMVLLTAPWWSASLQIHETTRLLPTAETGQPLRGETTFSSWALPYAGFVLSVGASLGPSTAELHAMTRDGALISILTKHWPAIGASALLVVALGWIGLRALGRRAIEPLLWASLVVVFALLLALRNVKPFNPRYVIALLPAVLIVLAAGLDRLRPRVGLFVLLAWLALSAVSLQRMWFDPAYVREDVRGAARLVEQREGADDVILVPTVNRVFDHYYRGDNPTFALRDGETAAPVDAAVSALEPSRRFLWYVRSRPWFDDPRGELLASLEARYRRLSEFTLPGVEILLYDRLAKPSATDPPVPPPPPGGGAEASEPDSLQGPSGGRGRPD